MNVGVALLTMLPGRAGGSETYVRGLLGAFCDGDGPDATTLLVSNISRPLAENFAGGQTVVAPLPSYGSGSSDAARLLDIARARLFARSLARDIPNGLDLVHYPVTVPVPRIRGLPTVVTLHDLQHRDLPSLFSRPERTFRSWAYDESARRAVEVITITAFSASRISEQLGIPEDRVHSIHLGIDHQRFKPEGEIASVPGLPERYVYYPANAWPHKNHVRLLEAFGRVDDPDLYLVLSGAGQEPRQGDEPDRVIRIGHVPSSQVPGLYRGATAVVFPSLYEGFGLPPLEAMACGCPVAASAIPALEEVCGQAFLPFPPTDVEAIAEAIERVTNDKALRASLIDEGLVNARRFTWAKTARQHVAVYRKSLERRN